MPDTAAELALAVRGVALAVQNYRLRAARAGFGVGAGEMTALSQLFAGGSTSPTDLAHHLSVTTASITELIDRLETAGHVTRRPHPTDGRRVVVELTSPARERIAALFALAEHATAVAACGLTPPERRAVVRFLHSVTEEYAKADPTSTTPRGRGR